MKRFLTTIAFLMTFTTAFGSESSVQTYEGLNIYCDPIDTVYAGGNPAFLVGMTKEEYLANKGLNQFCDPVGTFYAGGPLFDERTGLSMTLEEYLAGKKLTIIRGLNQFCEPLDTVYAGGSPAFLVGMTKEEYLEAKGLNEFCDAIDTVYASEPTFDENTGESITLDEYLANKELRIYE